MEELPSLFAPRIGVNRRVTLGDLKLNSVSEPSSIFVGSKEDHPSMTSISFVISKILFLRFTIPRTNSIAMLL